MIEYPVLQQKECGTEPKPALNGEYCLDILPWRPGPHDRTRNAFGTGNYASRFPIKAYAAKVVQVAEEPKDLPVIDLIDVMGEEQRESRLIWPYGSVRFLSLPHGPGET